MTIFSRIIAGEIPCYKIAENDSFFAFMDINPVNWGHTLVVPKKETDYIFDMDDDEPGRHDGFCKESGKGNQGCDPVSQGRSYCAWT